MYQSGLLGGPVENGLKLLPVRVTEDAGPAMVNQVETAAPRWWQRGGSHQMRKGVRVSLEGAVDPPLVSAVLESLRA